MKCIYLNKLRAQSEAHFDHEQWCNYFLHAGHLHIDGMSMSKSKKNFIKIKDALDFYTNREIRMLFLLHKYYDPMVYLILFILGLFKRSNG
jgi:cysteinyl-tRNA synthetase